MFLGDLIRNFWGGTLNVLHHLNPFDNTVRHPITHEPMEVDDDESFDLKGPAFRTRSAPSPPEKIATTHVNRRTYQTNNTFERKPVTVTPSKTSLTRSPLPGSSSPSMLTSSYNKLSAGSPVRSTHQHSTASKISPSKALPTSPVSGNTSRKPGSAATPHPIKAAAKRPASPRRLSPVRSHRKSASPARKPASAISLRTRSRSRGRPRSPHKEPTSGESGAEPKKASAAKAVKKVGRPKSVESTASKRSRRGQHEDVKSPSGRSKIRKASSSTTGKKAKKAKT